MSFTENGYEVVKNAVPKDVIEFLKINFDIHEYAGYATVKHPTAENPYPFGDEQTPSSFAFYSPLYGESLLLYLKPLLEKVTSTKLIETYSYMRIYYNGSILKRHIDRPSCEISATLCIKKEIDWPMFVENKNEEQLPIELEEGDLIIYRGNVIPHWREEYKGKRHYQMFLHFVDANGEYSEKFRWDKRPCLWAPPQLRKNN